MLNLIFNVVSEYKESGGTYSMYFVESFWLIKFSLWKSMHDIKNYNFFTIISMCPTSCFQASTKQNI